MKAEYRIELESLIWNDEPNIEPYNVDDYDDDIVVLGYITEQINKVILTFSEYVRFNKKQRLTKCNKQTKH